MKLTPFQQKVKYLKKKYNLKQIQIAKLLDTSHETISYCVHRKNGCTGAKFIQQLDVIIATLDGKYEIDLEYCHYCNNAMTIHISGFNRDGSYKCHT